MFSEYVHTSPALLPILGILHDELAASVLNTNTLLRYSTARHNQGRGEAEVEVLAVPHFWDVTRT